jgi:hypothetical protein
MYFSPGECKHLLQLFNNNKKCVQCSVAKVAKLQLSKSGKYTSDKKSALMYF